jgi:hypothetical protein
VTTSLLLEGIPNADNIPKEDPMQTDIIVQPEHLTAHEAGSEGADAFRQWINSHTPENWVMAFDKASAAKAAAIASNWPAGATAAQAVLDYLAPYRPVLQ